MEVKGHEELTTLKIEKDDIAAPWDKSTGLLHCNFVDAQGKRARWDVTNFKLNTKMDPIQKDWYAEGWGYYRGSPFDTRDDRYYRMRVSYAYLKRILTLDMHGYVFSATSREMQANPFENRNILNISFLRDVVGVKHDTGEQYTIEGRSKLNLVL